MPIFSMTGFGAGRSDSPELGSLAIEMRSVNSRFLDVFVRLPPDLSFMDPLIRASVQKKFSRGKLVVEVRFDPIPGATQNYSINRPLFDMLQTFCSERGHIPNSEDMLAIPGVVISQPDSSRMEELEHLVETALAAASKALLDDRKREGQSLLAAMRDLNAGMERALSTIGDARAQVVDRYRVKLQERIEQLLGPQGATLDAGRLEQEVAFFADKADIQEEVIRLGAHLEQLGKLLSSDGNEARGRSLDFLNQEILREVNTIGSKARDLEITRQVLEMKNLAESLKEQIANIE